MTWQRIVVVTLALAGLAMATNPATIAFIRPPAIVTEGTRVPFKVRIPPDDENRRVEISAFDKADGERVSFTERALDGRSAALVAVDLILPRGQLLVVGQLWGVRGSRGKATAPIRVMGKWDDEDEDALGGEEP